jgi:hypothetical protein
MSHPLNHQLFTKLHLKPVLQYQQLPANLQYLPHSLVKLLEMPPLPQLLPKLSLPNLSNLNLSKTASFKHQLPAMFKHQQLPNNLSQLPVMLTHMQDLFPSTIE